MQCKTESPRISIIVPVYQVAPYLPVCLDSILGQTFTDWEMLLVDDGSFDGGEIICDEYAKRDERVRVFHQKNAGLSAARNTGLNHARGQYYTMVDSDDLLATMDYLQILYDALIEHDADMSACGHLWFSDGAEIPKAMDLQSKTIIRDGKEFYFLRGLPKESNLLDEQGSIVTKRYAPIGAHGKLYRKQLFDNLRYPVGHILEDLAIAHRVYLKCTCIAVSGSFMYAYRRRPTGIFRSSAKSKIWQEEIYSYRDLLSYSLEIGDEEMTEYAGKKLRNLMRESDR